MNDYVSKTAIVTGAASGIGRATAELLLAQGDAVVAIDLSRERLAWTDDHARALAVAGDVSSEATNTAMVEAAVAAFGSLDTLVLNAGIAHIGSLAGGVDVALIDRLLGVNLRSVMLGLTLAVPAMSDSPRASIVTVASISGMFGEPAMGLYSATKGGVINLTRSAAVELGPRGIRVNCVCPGPTDTGMTKPVVAADPCAAETVCRNVPLKRFAQPEEIASVIAFLCSPAASFVHGAVVPVDGGVTANAGQYPPPDPISHPQGATHALAG